MRQCRWLREEPILRSVFGKLRKFGAAQEGSTAIEFGIVAMPFFMFMFSIMLISMKYFTENALEHGVEAAAREIRTGQAQNAGKTFADFRQMVCDEATSYISCDAKLVVHVQSSDEWSNVAPTPCLTGGALTPSAGIGTDPLANSSGVAEAVVLVTACYEWDMTRIFNFGGLGDLIGDMSNGSSLVKAVATFRTEPYQ